MQSTKTSSMLSHLKFGFPFPLWRETTEYRFRGARRRCFGSHATCSLWVRQGRLVFFLRMTPCLLAARAEADP